MNYWEAVATLVGTIFGAGILGLPYAVSQAGFIWGAILIIFLGLAALTLNLLFGEIILRTSSRHQLAGYVGTYLGKTAYRVMACSTIFGSFAAMSTYIVGEGKVLQALLGGDENHLSLLYFLVMAFILFIGLKLVKVFELFLVFSFLIIISIAIGLSSPHLVFENLLFFDSNKIFLPFGVALFAFGGVASVVHVREILRKKEQKMKSAIMIASFLPIIVYLVFSLVVVGLLGKETTPVATVGLGEKLGQFMTVFGNLFAFFVMGTSFLAVGLTVKQLFILDFKMHKNLAWFFTILVPCLIFLSGVRDFVWLMGLSGGLSVTISGVLILITHRLAKKGGDRKPEYDLAGLLWWKWIILLVLAGGAFYTLINLFKIS